MVEWVFAIETRRIVNLSKIDNVVDDILKLLEYAKSVPQKHLMSAGQLLRNRHCAQNPTMSAMGLITPICLGVYVGLNLLFFTASVLVPRFARGDLTWIKQIYGLPALLVYNVQFPAM